MSNIEVKPIDGDGNIFTDFGWNEDGTCALFRNWKEMEEYYKEQFENWVEECIGDDIGGENLKEIILKSLENSMDDENGLFKTYMDRLEGHGDIYCVPWCEYLECEECEKVLEQQDYKVKLGEKEYGEKDFTEWVIVETA